MPRTSRATTIVRDPRILGGRPHVRGTRLSVGFLLDLVASGATQADILRKYPELTRGGLSRALRWAAQHLEEDVTAVVRAGE
jgi:uncharacterized protein (DUF433 family)